MDYGGPVDEFGTGPGQAGGQIRVSQAARRAARSLHPTLPPEAKSALYKTELCRSFKEVGTCRYGDKCQFAHGVHELRSVPRHPKYKTERCRTFWSTGTCPYKGRCRFLHDEASAFAEPMFGDQAMYGAVMPMGPVSPHARSPGSVDGPRFPFVTADRSVGLQSQDVQDLINMGLMTSTADLAALRSQVIAARQGRLQVAVPGVAGTYPQLSPASMAMSQISPAQSPGTAGSGQRFFPSSRPAPSPGRRATVSGVRGEADFGAVEPLPSVAEDAPTDPRAVVGPSALSPGSAAPGESAFTFGVYNAAALPPGQRRASAYATVGHSNRRVPPPLETAMSFPSRNADRKEEAFKSEYSNGLLSATGTVVTADSDFDDDEDQAQLDAQSEALVAQFTSPAKAVRRSQVAQFSHGSFGGTVPATAPAPRPSATSTLPRLPSRTSPGSHLAAMDGLVDSLEALNVSTAAPHMSMHASPPPTSPGEAEEDVDGSRLPFFMQMCEPGMPALP